MRAVITVIGKDAVGIIAEVSDTLRSFDVNILDISQSVLSDLFAMVMLVDIAQCEAGLAVLADALNERGHSLGLTIHTMHEDIFNSMHRI